MTAAGGEDERIRQWRAQLAEEQDSDDDDAYGGLERPNMNLKLNTGADDDLGLELAEPPVSRLQPPPQQQTRRPATLSECASSDTRELILEHKVQVLQAQLHEREAELAHTMQQGGAPDASRGAAVLADAREAKMREMLKRSKAAMMALGRERAKTAQLSAELAAAKQQQQPAPAPGGAAPGSAAERLESLSAAAREAREGGVLRERERELKELKERSGAMVGKLHEQKVGNAALKAELLRYQRALAREVGDDVPPARLKELLDESSGAKGRAQQISLLKDQVKDLNRKLAAATSGAEVGGGGCNSGAAAEERSRGSIASIEAERR